MYPNVRDAEAALISSRELLARRTAGAVARRRPVAVRPVPVRGPPLDRALLIRLGAWLQGTTWIGAAVPTARSKAGCGC
jgi:hypothetical protein